MSFSFLHFRLSEMTELHVLILGERQVICTESRKKIGEEVDEKKLKITVRVTGPLYTSPQNL